MGTPHSDAQKVGAVSAETGLPEQKDNGGTLVELCLFVAYDCFVLAVFLFRPPLETIESPGRFRQVPKVYVVGAQIPCGGSPKKSSDRLGGVPPQNQVKRRFGVDGHNTEALQK